MAEQLVFIFGFDRSGTTALARVLAAHPDTELLMQPFNSSEFRQRMYDILNNENVSATQRQFIEGLTKGVIDTAYISSPWFFKYSTTETWKTGQLHIVKSTISHFLLPWLVCEFPMTGVWGIWRQPVDVIDSIFRNNFQGWYAGAIPCLKETVKSCNQLRQSFPDESFDGLSAVGEVAMNFAIRSFHLFQHLPTGNVIWYDEFCRSPNVAVERFRERFGLRQVDVAHLANRDLNMTGRKRNAHTACLTARDVAEIQRITEPAIELMESRHGKFRQHN